ncbi:NYN domain-containing protein [Porticoccaceae bacterium]|nr:NYN domain-containing protein [Porticoccaceae bacterium]
MKKIAVFVDVQNIYYTVKEQFGCYFNYRELWRQLSEQGEIDQATAYAIERNDAGQRGFQQVLREIGFEVKLKPFIQRSDGSAKGDWDVGIAIDVMDCAGCANPVDEIVLLSGDGDFDLLLARVSQRYSIATRVYGVEALTAGSLIDAADHFQPIQGSLLLK